MSDIDLINFLIAQAGSPKLAARALGTTKQRMFNWRRRGIPFRYRPAFRDVANRLGAKIPQSWLDASVPSVIVDPTPSGGKPNGRESTGKRAQKAEGKAKRSRPQQQQRRRPIGRTQTALA